MVAKEFRQTLPHASLTNQNLHALNYCEAFKCDTNWPVAVAIGACWISAPHYDIISDVITAPPF